MSPASGFHSQMLWSLSSQSKSPRLGSPTRGLYSSLLRADLYLCNIPSHLLVTVLGVCVLVRSDFCPSYASQCGSFFISFVVDELSASLQVFLGDSCSICSCSFDVVLMCLREEVSSGSSSSTIWVEMIWRSPFFSFIVKKVILVK